MIQREFKDRLFRFIFKDKEALLSLFNALYDTHYTDTDVMEITTLEDTIYMKMKNDVSFILDYSLCLFEHQSTINKNMPLRGFLYFARLFEKELSVKGHRIYSSKLIKLPTPKYIVFYNGDDMKAESMTLRLSDAFYEEAGKSCMELETLVLNVNYRKNRELMEKCRPLWEYAYFIHQVKTNLETMNLETAINTAVSHCIKENILKELLMSNRAEVMNMILTEYDEEEMKKIWQEEATEELQEQLEASRQREYIAREERKTAFQKIELLQQQVSELTKQLQALTPMKKV